MRMVRVSSQLADPVIGKSMCEIRMHAKSPSLDFRHSD